jgi:hypothetical protein
MAICIDPLSLSGRYTLKLTPNYWQDAIESCEDALNRIEIVDTCSEESFMLWTIFVILLVLWLVGLVSFHAIGAYIHILLVLAIVVLLIQLITGRRSAL